jgi:hypothetical protein
VNFLHNLFIALIVIRRNTPEHFYEFLGMSDYPKRVRNLAVSVYDLIPHQSEQLEMFSSKSHAVAEVMDKINDKYGEFVQYASTHDGDG